MLLYIDYCKTLFSNILNFILVSLLPLTITILGYYLHITKAKDGHPILLCNFIIYFAVFQKYSNSIFYPLMEYLTAKILYSHPKWKHVASVHSKRRPTVLMVHFIELLNNPLKDRK